MAYRGKYPRRIQSVWSGALRDFNRPELGKSYWLRTNDGTLFCLVNESARGKSMPRVGHDVTTYLEYIEQD